MSLARSPRKAVKEAEIAMACLPRERSNSISNDESGSLLIPVQENQRRSYLEGSGSRGLHKPVIVVVLAILAIAGWAFAAASALRRADASKQQPSGAFSSITQCHYSTAQVVNLIPDLQRFYLEIFSGNGALDLSALSLDDFAEVFSDYELGSQSLNRTFAAALQARLESAIADPRTSTLEKVQLGYSLADVALFNDLNSLDLYHTVHGDTGANAWFEDAPLLMARTADTLLRAGATYDPKFRRRLETWLANYPTKAEQIIKYWADLAAHNKTHSYVNMKEFYERSYQQALAYNYFALCSYENTAGPCAAAALKVQAANARLTDFYKTVYLPACQRVRPLDRPGLVYVPDGPEAYKVALKYNLGFTKSWQEIHSLGLKLVNETRKAIEQLSGLPFTKAAAMLADVNNSTLFFCTGPNGTYPTQQDVVAYAASLHQTLVKYISPEISYYPRGQTFYTIAKDTGTYWEAGTYDHLTNTWSSPAYFNIGLEGHCRNGGEVFEKASSLSTLAHEAFPGHGLQLPLQMEIGCTLSKYTPGAPNSFVEGWALYTESLPFHLNKSKDTPLGLYTDPVAHLGYLSSDILRDNRLVEDTGIHALGWSYQEACDYMTSNGFGADYAAEETRRYVSLPAQAVSYMMGRLQIQDMRKHAEAELGQEFRAPEFHALLTRFGGSTFDDLWKLLETYLVAKKGGSSDANSGQFRSMFGYDLVTKLNSGCSPSLEI